MIVDRFPSRWFSLGWCVVLRGLVSAPQLVAQDASSDEAFVPMFTGEKLDRLGADQYAREQTWSFQDGLLVAVGSRSANSARSGCTRTL